MDDIVRRPRQQRSRDSFEQLMAVGTELLMQGSDFSVAELSSQSGVSIGSIYQRFGSKDKIYLALQDRVLTQMDHEVDVLFEAEVPPLAAPDAVMTDAVTRFCSHVQRFETVLRSMIKRDPQDPIAIGRGESSCLKIKKAFVERLAEGMPKSDPRYSSAGHEFCFRMIFAATWHRITLQPLAITQDEMSWEQLAQELAKMCSAYLSNEGHSRPKIGQ